MQSLFRKQKGLKETFTDDDKYDDSLTQKIIEASVQELGMFLTYVLHLILNLFVVTVSLIYQFISQVVAGIWFALILFFHFVLL